MGQNDCLVRSLKCERTNCLSIAHIRCSNLKHKNNFGSMSEIIHRSFGPCEFVKHKHTSNVFWFLEQDGAMAPVHSFRRRDDVQWS